MRIDLHTHSTASDGTYTPSELVTAAADAGLDVVAITDHDSTAGWGPAAGALPAGLTLVRGAELSCRWYGVDPSVPLHMLAYLFDPADEALTTELARVRDERERRGERIVDLMRADGIDVTWEEVRGYADGGTVGRPHLARALVRCGLARTVGDAFHADLLGSRYRIAKRDIDVFTALRLVQAAGGVTVLAHPKTSKRGHCLPDELIAQMAAAGLFGIEADHEEHTSEARDHVKVLAGELGLVTTGSSDFHGTNKTVQIGANTTAPDVYEQIVSASTGCSPVHG